MFHKKVKIKEDATQADLINACVIISRIDLNDDLNKIKNLLLELGMTNSQKKLVGDAIMKRMYELYPRQITPPNGRGQTFIIFKQEQIKWITLAASFGDEQAIIAAKGLEFDSFITSEEQEAQHKSCTVS